MPKKIENLFEGLVVGREPPTDNPASVLAAEANHRVANNLSLIVSVIGLHRARLVQEQRTMLAHEVTALLDDIASNIETVARLNRLLSERPDAPAVDFTSYLRALCDTMASCLSRSAGLKFSASQDSCMVTRDQILPLALIVNEAFTNAIKYAHPTGLPVAIEVGCRRTDGGGMLVEVADDGVGLPEDFDICRDAGIGFRTMRLLARQIDGELTFDSSPLGLRCTVRLPDRVVRCDDAAIRRGRRARPRGD